MAKNDQTNNNAMSTAETGRVGGEETKKRDSEFYSEIGQKQGKENNPGNFANRDKEDVQEAGRRGGESRGNHQPDRDDDLAA